MSVTDRVAARDQPTRDPVLYEVRDSGVAVLTLNRPERMNGWGGGLAATFYARLDDAEADPEVRAIVVTGSGRAFCAGADMGDLNTISSATVDAAGGTDVSKLVGAAPSALRHDHAQARHRRDQRCLRGHGADAGVGVRRPIRRRGRQVHHVVRAARADRRVRHLLDPAARRRLGRRARPVAERAGVLRRRGRRTRPRQGGRARPTSCCRGRSPTPRTSPPTVRRVRWR